MYLFDSHCHLQFKAFVDDRDEVLNKIKNKDLIVNVVGTQKKTSQQAVQLAKQYDFVLASVGLHPIHLFKIPVAEEKDKFISLGEGLDIEYYQNLINEYKDEIIAIGEIGLDLYHLPPNYELKQVLQKQIQAFTDQVSLAKNNHLPVIIHVRQAHQELLKVLSSLNYLNGVVHCFSGDWTIAKQYLDLGLYLGFTGIISFPPKKTNPQEQLELIEVVKKTPLDRILIETDSPYLAPQKYRGQRAEPWMVEEVWLKIAEIKKMDVEFCRQQLIKNFKKLFNLN